ncbi:hypothetical protein DMN91_012038 [Ooceraea biroi]|uniref:Uncharacterized protein n=1 Tax=Ooceraea biroi TaxID=2015173 RepID=A0A3L8D8L8_OOCBI|nr:uncharacterized protein LOC105281557 isoform X1 [Ooceraea biroi]RLU16278.1 hypothetical protein DMN91_012038 [Ooceraea biroi]
MSSKTNTSCDTTTALPKNLRNCQTSKTHDREHKRVTVNASKEIVLLGQGDVVEVTVKRDDKAKGQKRTSPTVSSGHGQKIDKKRSMINNGEAPQSWGRVFAKQNLLYMTQSSSMSAKHREDKETRQNVGDKRQQASSHSCAKHMDPSVSSKRASCQKKSGDNSKMPCCVPVLVQDRAIQHPDMADSADRFAEFNPVRTLSFLIKELKDLVKNDKRTCEIFTEMERILSKMPVDSGRPLELGDLEMKLQTSTIQLKESSKKMKAMCESWTAEREKLHSQIQRRDVDLKGANQRRADLEMEIKTLTQQLEDATRTAKDELTALRRQVKRDELSDELISGLRTELAKQTELARKNYISNQYLTIERDKLSQLSSYQETLIVKYQDTIKELQAQVAEQLKALSKARANEENASPQISAIHTGFVCSSPTSSISDRSNKSWHDLSDVSSVPAEHALSEENVPVRDSVALKLVSLELDGESSHDIMFESCQNQVTGDKETVAQDNRDDMIIPNANNAKDAVTKKSLHRSPKKRHDKENDLYETRKEKPRESSKHSLERDTSKILRGVASNKSTSGTRRQDDVQSRIPINVPSPLREYLCSDWSDSSLSSVNTASADLDMVKDV